MGKIKMIIKLEDVAQFISGKAFTSKILQILLKVKEHCQLLEYKMLIEKLNLNIGIKNMKRKIYC